MSKTLTNEVAGYYPATEASVKEIMEYLKSVIFPAFRTDTHNWIQYDLEDGHIISGDEAIARSTYTGDNQRHQQWHSESIKRALDSIEEMKKFKSTTGNVIKIINQYEKIDSEIIAGFMLNKPLLEAAVKAPTFYSPFTTVSPINIHDNSQTEMLWQAYLSGGGNNAQA